MQRGTLNGSFTGITGTPVREMDYTLDPTGNWPTYLTKTSGTTDLNQSRTSNTVNEITSITASGGTPVWTTPAYDAAGNMTTMPQPASLTSSYTATYDAWNRLTQISASGTTVAKYQYDGRNRRIVKLTYTSGTLSETRHFYFTNNWQDIEERTGTSTSMDKQFVWGIRYIDELICRDDATPLRLYATQDANFNLTSLTNTSGTVQQRFQYDPYGNSTVLAANWTSTTDAYAWTPRFQGGQYDLATALYLFRNRDQHPLLGEWIERDPIVFLDGLNPYEYVGSNPVARQDSFGLSWTDCFGSPRQIGNQVCGYSIFLLTGSCCASPDQVLGGVNGYEQFVSCWWNCEVSVHGKACTLAADAAGAATVLTFTHLEITKLPENLEGTFDAASAARVTTLQSALSLRLVQQYGMNSISKLLRAGARAVKAAPFETAISSVAAGISLTEAVVSIYCGWNC